MTTIVLNTLTGAVTEYDWAFDSVTDTHTGDGSGLYLLGGDTDDGQPIVAEAITGKPLFGSQRKKRPAMVWLSMKGSGTGQMIVQGEGAEWRYPFPIRATGQSRAQPGKGICENYLAFGFSNPGGEAFSLDRIEVQMEESKTRRVG